MTHNISVWTDPPADPAELRVTQGDLARFAHIRGNRQTFAAQRSASSQPVVSMLQSQWGEFVSFCDAACPPSSSTTITHAGSGVHGTVELLEQYFALRTNRHAIRHSGILTEELLLLCVPCMSSILERQCEEAADAYDAATTRIASLAAEEPWRSEFAELQELLRAHVEYCERIELDKNIGSVEKGAALAKLLELRHDKSDLVDALKREQLRLLPSLEPFRARLEVTFCRVESHRVCRGQGRGVMQHLPSFECTALSDRSNDCWRPVRSALLFSGWELATRALHDAYREHVHASHGGRCPPPPEVEDEVEVVQGILSSAMRATPVHQQDFFRLASTILKW
jgi:hypothetical protein